MRSHFLYAQLNVTLRQQKENAELARLEAERISLDIEVAKKELLLKKEELHDMKLAQTARRSQIARLSQLAQPIEPDVTYLFDEKPLPSGMIDSGPSVSHKRTHMFPKQIRTGDMLQLENRVDQVTRIAMSAFTDFEHEFISARSISSACEEMVLDKIKTHIEKAKKLIDEMDQLDQQSFFSVRELLTLRLKILVAQRMEVEELHQLVKEKQFFEQKENEMKSQLITEVKQLKQRLKVELNQSTKSLLQQLDEIHKKRDLLKRRAEQESLMEKEKLRPGTAYQEDRYVTESV